jgi:uncharacterized protein (TIGR03083 family)
MQQPGQAEFFGEITASTATLAGIVGRADNDLPVPSCPDWTLGQLAAHLGWVHRWAAEIVRTRSPERIAASEVPDSRFPAGAAERARWLSAGAGRLTEAISEAGEDPVWAFGVLRPASFWGRRQAHETMVHRADAELAAGQDVLLDQRLAADGIDEWLSFVADPGFGREAAGLPPLPPGATLRLTAGTAAPAGADGADGAGVIAGWLVTGSGGGLTVQRASGPAGASPPGARLAGTASVAVDGPAGRLLLVLLGRLPASEPAISVTGDASLLSGWLAATPF